MSLSDPQELLCCSISALFLPFSVSLLFIILKLWGNTKEENKKLLSNLQALTQCRCALAFSSGLGLHSHKLFPDLNKTEVTRISSSPIFAGPLGLLYKGSAFLVIQGEIY